MASFQGTVLILAILFLIVILVLIGLLMWKNKTSQTWPPSIAACPDYWVAVDKNTPDAATAIVNYNKGEFDYSTISNASSSGTLCLNIQSLGTDSGSGVNAYQDVMDFTAPQYAGASGNCAKYNWATNNGVTWDGITYGTTYTPCTNLTSDYIDGGAGSTEQSNCITSMFGMRK